MRLRRSGPARTRERAKGVAVLELTLSLVFLIPLLMATLDFGYYFYVGAAVQEAARQGLEQAVLLGGSCPLAGPGAACPAAVNNVVTNKATSGTSGTTCTGQTAQAQPPAAACYLNGAPLTFGSSSDTTIACTCAQSPVNPTYTITVTVEFPPALGYFKLLMPAGASSSNVRYRASLTGS